jgi:hypothetical protein
MHSGDVWGQSIDHAFTQGVTRKLVSSAIPILTQASRIKHQHRGSYLKRQISSIPYENREIGGLHHQEFAAVRSWRASQCCGTGNAYSRDRAFFKFSECECKLEIYSKRREWRSLSV